MSTFSVPIELGNRNDGTFETVEMLVDTGASYTALPTSLLESVGVERVDSQSFELADGSVAHLDMGEVLIRYDNRARTTPVVFVAGNATPLLGAVTLEQFGLGVDPVKRRLIPVNALLLGYRPPAG